MMIDDRMVRDPMIMRKRNEKLNRYLHNRYQVLPTGSHEEFISNQTHKELFPSQQTSKISKVSAKNWSKERAKKSAQQMNEGMIVSNFDETVRP